MTRIRAQLAAGLFAVAAVVALGVPLNAAGERTACPSSNPPNMLAIVEGSPQTARVGTQFQNNLQVVLTNSNGCPLTGSLAGIPVSFSAPGSGPSGIFAASGSTGVTVGTNAQGVATAPMFTANDIAGSYTVRAESEYGRIPLALTNTAAGVAASIAATGATEQDATVNSQYGQPLRAQVLDANGQPVPGVSVSFSLATGATGAGANFLGGGAQATATTNANGQATSPPFVANNNAGRFTAIATTAGISAVATFVLANHAAGNTLTATTQEQLTATVNGRFASPLEVRVLDATGRPIEGVSVTFMLQTGVTGAGASFLGGGTEATAITKANGQATSPPVVANGIPGRFTATATAADISTAATFNLANHGAGTTLVATTPEQQTATVDSAYQWPLEARVLDADGQPIEGASVTFTLPAAASGAGASFLGGGSQASVLTDDKGQATSPPLRANNTAGRFTATATVAGVAAPVTYRLKNLAGKVDAIAAGAASGQAAATGARFPIRLAVTVTDANKNPVEGALVTFTAPARGPSGHFGRKATRIVRVTTNASGVAMAPTFTASRLPGGYVVIANVGGAKRPAAFALVNERR